MRMRCLGRIADVVRLELAIARAARDVSAFIALFRTFYQPIATDGHALDCGQRAPPPNFKLARGGAPISRDAVGIVTLFGARNESIAAYHWRAGAARFGTDGVGFDRARFTTTIAVGIVAIVTRLTPGDETIATPRRDARRFCRRTGPSRLRLARGGAAIPAVYVAVIALLAGFDDPIAALRRRAGRRVDTRKSWLGARVIGFALTSAGASVAGVNVAVVAALSRIEHTIATNS